MRVAIIDEDIGYLNLIKNLLSNYLWQVNYFNSSSEFGVVSLDIYDVIIVNHNLSTIKGRDLIRSISSKTEAQLFLMGDVPIFQFEDVENERIKGLIDKNDVNNIIDQLKYIDVKLRLDKIIESESDKFGDVVPLNGFHIEVMGDILVVYVSVPLSSKRLDGISKIIEDKGLFKIIIRFRDTKYLTSMHLGFLVSFYKKFSKNRKLVFVNDSDKKSIEQIRLCNLDILYPVFNSIDEALYYLAKL